METKPKNCEYYRRKPDVGGKKKLGLQGEIKQKLIEKTVKK